MLTISAEAVAKLEKIYLCLKEINKSINHFDQLQAEHYKIFFNPQIVSALLGALMAGIITWVVTTFQIKRTDLIHQKRDYFRLFADLIFLLPDPNAKELIMSQDVFQALSRSLLELECYYMNDRKLLAFSDKYIFPLHKFIKDNYIRTEYLNFNKESSRINVFYVLAPKKMSKSELIKGIPGLSDFVGSNYKDNDIISESIIDSIYKQKPGSEVPIKEYMIKLNAEEYKALHSRLLEEYNRLKRK